MPAAKTPDSLTITPTVARRYLLGRQGLWPARRWKGKTGAATAIRTLGSVQMDPLTIVSRSHDLVLWSRVDAYSPSHLDALMYKERRFFDYGGHLDIYPIQDLPYWRPLMDQRRDHGRWRDWAKDHAAVINHVHRRITAEGPLSARDFEATQKVAGFSYRGSKEAGVALYYLWITGQLMSHSRRGAERVYDLFERIAPAEYQHAATLEDAARYLDDVWIRSAGLAVASAASSLVLFAVRYAATGGGAGWNAKQRLQALLAERRVFPVRVEGVRDQYYAPTEDLPLLETLARDRIPRAWQTKAQAIPTTDHETIFLSPLDNLLDRRRTKSLFDFEYLWEIYKKPEQRRWGRYTMPVLYQDRLVARFDPRLNRTDKVLSLEGFWLENDALSKDRPFAAALARGLRRFATFHDATLDPGALGPAPLCERVKQALA